MARSSDPFLEEVHALKKAASARFGHDIGKMIEYANGLAVEIRGSRAGRSSCARRAVVKRRKDPFLDEIHAVKRAVSAAAGHNVRRMASKAGAARRAKLAATKKKSAA